MSFTISSPAFPSGAEIPKANTCQGPDVSPLLTWIDSPQQTTSFALIVDDPDAPAGTWVHWVMWNIPAATHLLPENVPRSARLQSGALQGRNDFGKTGYNGPCPPPGKTHRYFFRLYALDAALDLEPGATRSAVLKAITGHVVAEGRLMGKYSRSS